jgi:hypothetical protein
VLTQSFQNLTGTLRSGTGPARAISTAKLRGNEMAFTVGGAQYSGRVTGSTIEGTVSTGSTNTPWRCPGRVMSVRQRRTGGFAGSVRVVF